LPHMLMFGVDTIMTSVRLSAVSGRAIAPDRAIPTLGDTRIPFGARLSRWQGPGHRRAW